MSRSWLESHSRLPPLSDEFALPEAATTSGLVNSSPFSDPVCPESTTLCEAEQDRSTCGKWTDQQVKRERCYGKRCDGRRRIRHASSTRSSQGAGSTPLKMRRFANRTRTRIARLATSLRGSEARAANPAYVARFRSYHKNYYK